jgi:hypothetical protein
MRWFDDNGIRFVRGVPAMRPQDDGMTGANLFEPQPRGTALDRFAVQATQIVAGQKEGGFFIMIGRKPPATAPPAETADRPVVTVETIKDGTLVS